MPLVQLEQWQIDRLNVKKARIESVLARLDACLESFLINPTQSYTLNTGMTTQQVTRASLPALRAWRDDLDRELDDLLAQLNGVSRSAYFRPGF